MTDERDQLTADLEAIGRSLPDIPSTFGELRSLIERLNSPTLPNIKSARSGVATDVAVSAFGSGQSALAGDPVGADSGAALGVVSQLFYGKANLLDDPTIDGFTGQNPIPVTTPAPTTLDTWKTWYLLNSGTAPASRGAVVSLNRASNQNPYNSQAITLLTGTWGAAGSIDMFFQNVNALTPSAVWPYVVGAARFGRDVTNMNLTNLTSITAWVEIVDGSGVVQATSTPLDFLAFYSANVAGATKLLSAAWSPPLANPTFLRIRLRVVVSGAGAAATRVNVGEPQLIASTIEVPPPFAPILAEWNPTQLANNGIGTAINVRDTAGHTVITVAPTNPGVITVGDGSNPTVLDLGSGKLRLPLGTGALTATEAYAQWDSARKFLAAYDLRHEKPISTVGWLPYAFPVGVNTNATFGSTLTLPVSGGSVAFPIVLEAPMLLDNIVIGQKDAASLHTLEVRLYEDRLNFGVGSNQVDFVVGSDAAFSFTPGAADVRSAVVSGAPVILPPGVYWCVIRNTSATITAGIGLAASGTYQMVANAMTKTIGSALGAQIDLVAATWTKTTGLPSVMLNGRVFGQATSW